MASTIWKGTISFGLVNVPVKVTAGARSVAQGFNLLHGKCGSKINQYRHCASCGTDVEYAELVKGLNNGDDTYTVLSKKELEACVPASSKVMEIERVIPLAEVDPLLYESSYYLEPEEAGRKGYKLLLLALEKERKAAVAKITMHQREHLVLVRPMNGVLMFHTLYYSSEVRETPSIPLDGIQVSAAELKLASELLKVSAGKFEHESYSDQYQSKVDAAIAQKRRNQPVKQEKQKEARETAAIDIAKVLQMSINKLSKQKKGSKAA
jgi:DNA end-binding protein Ku